MIRLAKPEDCLDLLNIYGYYVKNTVISFEYEVPTIEDFEGRIRRVQQQLPWLVHEQNGQVTGYAYASMHNERAAYQWSVNTSVYVHPDLHRQGIARSLYKTLLKILRCQGYINAYAGITLPNHKSEKFHEAMGYTLVGTYEKVGYKFGQWHSVAWFSLLLQEHVEMPTAPTQIKMLKEDASLGISIF